MQTLHSQDSCTIETVFFFTNGYSVIKQFQSEIFKVQFSYIKKHFWDFNWCSWVSVLSHPFKANLFTWHMYRKYCRWQSFLKNAPQKGSKNCRYPGNSFPLNMVCVLYLPKKLNLVQLDKMIKICFFVCSPQTSLSIIFI